MADAVPTYGSSKHDIARLGRLGSGLGWYRFAYYGGTRTYAGFMTREVPAHYA